jgi:DNA-binding transcriptional MerR regulator
MSIGEVAETVDLPVHLLRQWEEKFPQLRPRRDRANRRYYSAKDLEIVRRIKTLLHHERMTVPGARKRLAQELYGEGRPRTNSEVLDLVDQLETRVRGLLDRIDTTKRGGRTA